MKEHEKMELVQKYLFELFVSINVKKDIIIHQQEFKTQIMFSIDVPHECNGTRFTPIYSEGLNKKNSQILSDLLALVAQLQEDGHHVDNSEFIDLPHCIR